MTPSGPASPSPSNPLQTIGAFVLAFYVFILLGRLPEILITHFGTSLHITMAILIVMIFICVAGGMLRGLVSKPGICLILFTLWILIALPFSVWKGGTAKVLTDYWVPAMLIFFAAAGLMNTAKDCWRVFWAVCLAMGFLVTLGPFLFGIGSANATGVGRFGFSVGTLANANLLGQHLVYGLPFCLLMPRLYGVFSAKGLIGVIVSVLLFLMILKTGSRATMAALLAMAVIFFLEASVENKLKLVFLYVILLVGGLVFAPSGAMERYKLMFSSDAATANADQVVDTAIASSEARKRHLEQSLALTAEYPIFGVGPGMFMVGAADFALKHNQRADWLETHNTFTQVSSETGIPGVAFYLFMIVFSIKPLFGVIKKLQGIPELRDLAIMAATLRLSFVGTILAALFASLAYEYYFPLLAGFSVSLVYVAEKAIRELQQTQIPQPVPVVAKPILGRSNRPKGVVAQLTPYPVRPAKDHRKSLPF